MEQLNENEHPIIHSDRGCHYRWPGWIERVENAGLERSMSQKGCSPDNAACEGLFGRIKNEIFYNRDWYDTSIQQFIDILNEYLIWYNNRRIKESLGYMSPREYRQSWISCLAVQDSVRTPVSNLHIYAFSEQIDLKTLRFISQIHSLISSREIRIRLSGSVPAGNSSFRSLIWSRIIPPVFTGA